MSDVSSSYISGISVVLPCLNEEASVGRCVREILACSASLNIPVDIIVADNGSSDGSVKAASEAGARIISCPFKRYGTAVRRGIAAAKYPYVITGDSDGQHIFNDRNFTIILRHFIDGAQFVNGNRFHKDNADYKLSPGRRFANSVLTFCFNKVYRTNLHDVTCGMNGYVTDFFNHLPFCQQGMELNIESRALHVLHGAVIREADIECGHRVSGHSHVRFADVLRHIFTLFIVRLRHCRRQTGKI